VQLVGDKKIDKPLLTLLGKALTKHLVYPKSALDLNVKGTSIIGFLLYPDGRVSDVQLLRTSRAEVLDNAALAAANAISPVNHVGPYLAKPKFMVIGIIFE
jgi:TonB family protein